MRSFYLAALATIICVTAPAQLHPSTTSVKHHYTGVIGGKYKFLMNLYFNDKDIEGEYRYYTQTAFLQVNGTYDASTKKFNLTESAYDWKKQEAQTTGYFEGINKGSEISGTWFNKDRTKSFEFVLTTDEKQADYELKDNSKEIDGVLVTDSIAVASSLANKQLITGFLSEVAPDTDPISLEDINFDGYLDILVIEMTGAKNTPYLYWVYHPSSSQFVRHDELQASDPVVDLQRKQIVSDWTSGAAIHGTDKYTWSNDDQKFFLIESTETDLSVNKTTVTKYRIENGKSVKQ